jgi:hypothetical protein
MLLGTLVTIARGYRVVPAEERSHIAVAAALFFAALVNAQFSGDIATNASLWLSTGLVYGVAYRFQTTQRRPLAQLRVARPRGPELHLR